MTNFAIIQTGGKQYKVSTGQKIKIEKLSANEGDNFIFDKVLLIADDRRLNTQINADNSYTHQRKSASNLRESALEVKIGAPYIEGVKVEGKILKQARDKKKIVFKYHSKTRYRKKKGHRQHFTEVEIGKIIF